MKIFDCYWALEILKSVLSILWYLHLSCSLSFYSECKKEEKKARKIVPSSNSILLTQNNKNKIIKKNSFVCLFVLIVSLVRICFISSLLLLIRLEF